MSYRKHLMMSDEPPSELYKAVELGTNLAEVGTDCISRQAAIRWVKTECNPYGKPTLEFESGKKVIEHLEQMPSARPEPHWIPVTERLPEENGEYLCQEKQGFLYIDAWNGEYWECADIALGIVTAWMPLPEPFKGVTE